MSQPTRKRHSCLVASKNLELVRSIYPAWERGDWSSAEWADPDIEFGVADGPAPISVTGINAMGPAWREFLDTWEDWWVKPEEYRELDEERVLVFVQIGGRGKTSGLEVEQMHAKGANLFHIRDGKVTRLILYFNYEHALADLGQK